MMIYLQLFFEFFKAGLFAIGGGMATLPFLYDISDKTGWFTYGQLADMVAISESTPGPIGVNMATYVGFTTAGISGSVIATLGLITPSIIIIPVSYTHLDVYKRQAYRISRATCTISIKEFWRSSAVVDSPVIRESEMVRMESAWAPASAALA